MQQGAIGGCQLYSQCPHRRCGRGTGSVALVLGTTIDTALFTLVSERAESSGLDLSDHTPLWNPTQPEIELGVLQPLQPRLLTI